MRNVSLPIDFCRALTGLAVFAWGLCAGAAEPRIWTFDRDLEGWAPGNWESIAVRDGVIDGETKYDSQLLSPVLNIRAEDYSDLLVRVQSDTSAGGEVFFGLPGKGLDDKIKARHILPASPDFVLHRIRLTGAPGWTGRVERIRFDPLNPAGAHVRIDFIALVPSGLGQMLNGGAEMAAGGMPIEWTAGPGAVRVRSTVALPAHTGDWFLRALAKGWWETRPFDLSFLNEVRVDFFGCTSAGDSGPVQVAARFLDLAGHEIARKTAVASVGKNWTPAKLAFSPPTRAADVCIRFGAGSGGLDIDDVRVRFGPRAAITEGAAAAPGQPRWHAAWIWHPAVLNQDHTRVFFRRTLDVPDAPLLVATVQITADDEYAFSLNGKEVHQTYGDHDGWRTPEVLDLRKALRPGKNVVLIEAHDNASAQGLLAEFAIVPKTGPRVRVVTDPSWSASLEVAGPWVPAVVVGRPPCSPWGPLPFQIVTPPVPVQVRFSASPGPVHVPGSIPFTVRLTPEAAGPGPVFAEIALEQKGRTLRRVWAPRPFFPAHAKVGVADTVSDWQVSLPWVLRRGSATARLILHGAQPVDMKTAVFPFRVESGTRANKFPRAEMRADHGIVRLFVNGREVNPTQGLFLRPDTTHLRNAARAGIRVWGIGLQEAGFYENAFDYAKIDDTLGRYLEACPDAWLILNLILDGRYQGWWIKKHPETHACLENGSDRVGGYNQSRGQWPSMSSPVWRETYARLLRNLVRHLRKTPYASRILGIQPCAGITWEWFHWGAQSRDLVDYSPAGQADFRRWLRAKYRTDAALRAAWHRPKATLAAARVPPTAERKHPAHGMFYDPATQQDVIDYHRYQHEVVAENIRSLYGVIKKESGGRLLCGTYYGYVMYLAESPGFSQSSGHFALHSVLACPNTDYGIAPTTYSWRETGESPQSMTAFGSFGLHGKLWWDQADLRTHWADQDHGRPPDLRGSIEHLRREAVRALAQGTAIQWYDFSKGWIFGDERIGDELTRLQALLDQRGSFRPMPRAQTLAVVLDERQMGRFDIFAPPYASALIHNQIEQLARSGVPWRLYLFQDLLEQPKLLEHQAFLFLGLFCLTADERAFLRDKVMRDGRLAAFVGPVGIEDPTGFDAAHTGELLGCAVNEVKAPMPLAAAFAKELPAPWTACAGETFGTPKAFSPNVLPTGVVPGGHVLARFTKDGEPATWIADRAGGKLFWSAAPGLPPAAIRALAHTARLPVVCDSNDICFICADAVGIHTRQAGDKQIELSEPGAVEEVFSGKTWPAGTHRFKVHIEAGKTALFRITRPIREHGR